MTSEQQNKLQFLLDQESGLQGREIDFIDNLDQNWRERSLTDKQDAWLEKIYDRLYNGR